MSVDELYQEIILDHYRSPRGKGPCAQCAVCVHQDNPLCGDEIDLRLKLSGGAIERIAFEGRGCAISQASASMMTEAVEGRTTAEALALVDSVRALMQGGLHPGPAGNGAGAANDLEDTGDLMALQGVAKFPVRVKCALLPWMALTEAIAAADEQGPSMVTGPA